MTVNNAPSMQELTFRKRQIVGAQSVDERAVEAVNVTFRVVRQVVNLVQVVVGDVSMGNRF